MNRQTVEYWKEQGADNVRLSVEANLQKLTAWGTRTAKWWFTAICR
ncbi:MAG: hypothetical protein ACLUD9_02560 [Anaerotignum faecicola]